MDTTLRQTIRYKFILACKIIFIFAWLVSMNQNTAIAAGTSTANVRTVCPAGCDHTTIQAAITAANPGDTIQLTTTSPHTEYDIVVNKNVTIAGLGGSITSVVQAANSAGTATKRVFYIQSGVTVVFNDLEIRYGGVDLGGGIYNDGGQVTLNNVQILVNESGGVFNTGTIDINHSEIEYNESLTHGGGIWNSGTAIIQDSNIMNNVGGPHGGGIYNAGNLTISHSNIIYNDAISNGTPSNGQGGGIYNTGTLVISNDTLIFDNRALWDIDAISQTAGAGIFSSGTTIIRDSLFDNNSGQELFGGAIYVDGGNLQLIHVIIKSHTGAERGGGLYLNQGTVNIERTVLYDNLVADSGGGIYHQSGNLLITNSTISGNAANNHGGGIYAFNGIANLANVTISDNAANADTTYGGYGGGVYVYNQTPYAGTINLQNTIIAGNYNLFATLPPVRAADCYGVITSEGYNLIGTLGVNFVGNPPCSVAGLTVGNLIGQDALLGPLSSNGGATETHALLANSPAINAGNTNGCRDYDNELLTTDQRNGLRVDRCDIGAFELGALTEHLFLPVVLNK